MFNILIYMIEETSSTVLAARVVMRSRAAATNTVHVRNDKTIA
jgi:hypothetical protein